MANYRPDVQSGQHRSPESVLEGMDVGSFDWTAYQGSYRGRALVTRLSHIPSLLLSPSSSSPTPTSTSLALAQAALLRLIPLLKSDTWDHELYLTSLNHMDEIQHPSKRLSRTTAGAGDRDPASAEAEGTGEERAGGGMELDNPTAGAGASATGKGGEAAGQPDYGWVEEAKEHEKKEGARLDVELRGYSSNLIKESIRLTYLAMAQLAVKVGNVQNAMKHYTNVREYSTSPQHHVDLGVAILEACLSFNLLTSLPGHISKLEATLDRLHPPAPPTSARPQGTAAAAAAEAAMTAADLRERREGEARSANVRRNVVVRVRVAKGLVALGNGEWARAGRELGEIGEEGGLGEWEGKAISSADLALITAFCTLASAERDRIRRVLLDRPSFRAQVDDNEIWLLDLVRSFVDAKYGEVRRLLTKAEPILLLNPFLSPHAQVLVHTIQTRAVVQYVKPFSTVQIGTMAQAFGMDQTEMLGLVERLVMDGDVKGRIDLIDKVLELTAPDHREELFENALKVGIRTNDLTQAAIFRMKLVEAGIIVDPRPKADDLAAQVAPADGAATPGPGSGVDEGVDMPESEQLPSTGDAPAPAPAESGAVESREEAVGEVGAGTKTE